jgi:hypothetical protein
MVSVLQINCGTSRMEWKCMQKDNRIWKSCVEHSHFQRASQQLLACSFGIWLSMLQWPHWVFHQWQLYFLHGVYRNSKTSDGSQSVAAKHPIIFSLYSRGFQAESRNGSDIENCNSNICECVAKLTSSGTIYGPVELRFVSFCTYLRPNFFGAMQSLIGAKISAYCFSRESITAFSTSAIAFFYSIPNITRLVGFHCDVNKSIKGSASESTHTFSRTNMYSGHRQMITSYSVNVFLSKSYISSTKGVVMCWVLTPDHLIW